MNQDLFIKIFEFLQCAQQELLTADAVIYQAFEENSRISQDDLRTIVNRAIASVEGLYATGSPRLTKFAYKGVCSLRDLGALNINLDDHPGQIEDIAKNVNDLKRNIGKGRPKKLYELLYNFINNLRVSNLTWDNPLSSKVISDEIIQNEIIQKLDEDNRVDFLKPVSDRVPKFLPANVEAVCKQFVDNFVPENADVSYEKYSHDGTWKEGGRTMKSTTRGILRVLKKCWNNPVLKENVNEGTYVNTVIMPVIQAALKDMPLLISCSERQSHASADRKGDIGRKPDIMVEVERNAQMYEILYAECSRMFSPPRKKLDDQVKLWRVMNDGMYWLRKFCKPEKGQFGILGVQVFRKMFRVNVLIRDEYDIHFHYRLIESEIPVRQSDVKT
ncbi:10656_t:CDS:2, partial [Paraglomus brasilianum]